MLKNIILIENNKKYQCDTKQEVVKMLLDEDFYNLSEQEKNKKMHMKAIANCFNNMEISDGTDLKNNFNINEKFIIKDETTYILSLLITNKIILLERIDSNEFTKQLVKSKFTDNYIIVNKFAKELLQKYMLQ